MEEPKFQELYPSERMEVLSKTEKIGKHFSHSLYLLSFLRCFTGKMENWKIVIREMLIFSLKYRSSKVVLGNVVAFF